MARNITFEPCTLVYTLLNPKKLKFEDFSLIVRSLHNYQVESIIPNAEMNNVHVKLNYQASITNAANKLGALRPIIGISKLSNFVKESEYTRLEQLRLKYGIASSEPGETGPSYPQPPRQQFKQRRGIFPSRPAPYQKKPRPSVSFSTNVSEIYQPETLDITDGEQDFPGEETIAFSDTQQLFEDNPGDQ